MADPGFRCRSCGHEQIDLVLSLGRTPLANSLVTAEGLGRPEPTYPLDVVRCRGCTLVQITESVPPEELFREYAYFSSYSDTLLQHAERLAGQVCAERRLGGQSLVMEVASNDGYLLQCYRRAGVPVVGIEPARNIAKVAEERGIPTLSDFFGAELAQTLRREGRQADVIHAHNVLAHVPDLNGFVQGLALVLRDSGVAIIEAPYVKDLIDHCEFDTIYHEHLSYFSLTALDRLFARHGLTIQRAERVPIHGGSLRIYAQRRDRESGSRPSVEALLAEEAAWGVDRPDFYRDFATRVARLKETLLDTLHGLRGDGHRLAAYGAAAKGTTLLGYVGIGSDVLDFVVDRSPHKQGKYMPGSRLPILAPAALLERQPAYVLLLTWNFAEEILRQQETYRQRGGRFIVPIPEVRIV